MFFHIICCKISIIVVVQKMENKWKISPWKAHLKSTAEYSTFDVHKLTADLHNA